MASNTKTTLREIAPNANGIRVGLSDDFFASAFQRYFPGAIVLTDIKQAEQCDLIIFTGGADIDPKNYNEQDSALCYTDVQRDAFELALFKAADAKEIKMYGSCRGHQLFNVGRGGTLIQDLRTAGRPHQGTHELKWSGERGKKLRAVFPSSVNSLHHQGLAKIGKNISIVAEFNGVPEIIVSNNLLGTQFHPELMDAAQATQFFQLVTDWVKAPKVEDTPKPASA